MSRRTGAPVVLVLLLAACATGVRPPGGEGPPPPPLRADPPGQTLHLAGTLRGAFPGVGPEVGLELWLRGDGRARIDLRSTDEDDRPTHEVLLWGPESCLLFDARTGRFTELGDADGTLHALGNAFGLRDAVFLLGGRDPLWPGLVRTEFLGTARDHRGVRESGTLHREADEASLRWQDDEGTTREISVTYEDYLETLWGLWPRRLLISGTELEAAARLHWTRVDPIVVSGDSIFDPLWEPAPH